MTGSDDLAARLERARQQLDEANVPGLLEDAAREIRRLRAENERLRAAVPPMNAGSTIVAEGPGWIEHY
jgi:hypothetical protein